MMFEMKYYNNQNSIGQTLNKGRWGIEIDELTEEQMNRIRPILEEMAKE